MATSTQTCQRDVLIFFLAMSIAMASVGIAPDQSAAQQLDPPPAKAALPARPAEIVDLDTLKMVADGHRTNLDSFRVWNCNFAVYNGTAASVKDALAGKYERRTTEHVVFRRDHDKMCYELKGDEKTMKIVDDEFRNAKSDKVAVSSSPYSFLSNGKLSLSYVSLMNAANIRKDPAPTDGVQTPLELGIRLEKILQLLIKDELAGSCRKAKKGELIEVTTGKKTLPGRNKYTFDSAKGFSLVRADRVYLDKNVPMYASHVTEIKDCGKGMWFPMRTVEITPGGDANGPHHVREIAVNFLEVEGLMRDEDFTIEIGANVQISEMASPDGLLTIEKATRIRLKDLDAMAEAREKLLKK